MKRSDLQAALDAIPDFVEPQAALEQYRTPAAVAAELLWEAREQIQGAQVVDLGCGTGMFAAGAVLLGAAGVTGVDKDPRALEAARGIDARFVCEDVATWQPDRPYDVAIMNPPFGAQNKGADRPFYEAAARAVKAQGGSAWFLAQPKTERFLAKEARRLGAHLDRVLSWPYPIEARFSFHHKDVATIDVAGYEMSFGA